MSGTVLSWLVGCWEGGRDRSEEYWALVRVGLLPVMTGCDSAWCRCVSEGMLPATATVSACIVDMRGWRGEELLSAVGWRGFALPSAVGGREEGLSAVGGRVEGLLPAVGGRWSLLLFAVGGRQEGLLSAVGWRGFALLSAVGGRQEGLLSAVDGWVLCEVGGRGEGLLSAVGGRGEGLGECWSILSSRWRSLRWLLQ